MDNIFDEVQLNKLGLKLRVERRDEGVIARGAKPFYATIETESGWGTWYVLGDTVRAYTLYGNGSSPHQAILNLAGYVRGANSIKAMQPDGTVY